MHFEGAIDLQAVDDLVSHAHDQETPIGKLAKARWVVIVNLHDRLDVWMIEVANVNP